MNYGKSDLVETFYEPEIWSDLREGDQSPNLNFRNRYSRSEKSGLNAYIHDFISSASETNWS